MLSSKNNDSLSSSEETIVRINYSPRRFRLFESTVKLTFLFGPKNTRNFSGAAVQLKIFKKWKVVSILKLKLFKRSLEIPCDTFSVPGRYFIDYFIPNITKTFIPMTNPIVVRSEKVLIGVKKNLTVFNGPVSALLYSRSGRCKAYKGTLYLYWRKKNKENILVTSKKVDNDEVVNKIQVSFRCNVIDTAGVFYFKYTSDYNNVTMAASSEMLVNWGKYKMEAQSKNIFPCYHSFAIKYSSPFCDRNEDHVEVQSKTYKNVIHTQTAFHGFRSVFFSCSIFKRYIREYCFYYTTKSNLSKKKKIHASLCLPSEKRG